MTRAFLIVLLLIIPISAQAAAPTANAGLDRTITDTDNSGSETIILDGSASTDDGSITMYDWFDVDNSFAFLGSGQTLSVTRAVGAHNFQLIVVDDESLSDSTNIMVTVQAPPLIAPSANAGGDRTVIDSDGNGSELVTLDGSASADDVSISTYVWTETVTVNQQTQTNTLGTGATLNVTLALGQHTITLLVTDGVGLTNSTTVTITVSAATVQNVVDVVELDPNETAVAVVIDDVCPRLSSATSLTAAQQDLLNKCTALKSSATSSAQAKQALRAITGEEVGAQRTNALELSGAQYRNLGARINGLKQGASGLQLTGLQLNIDGQEISATVLAQGIKTLLGAAAGDEGNELALSERWGFFANGSIGFGDQDASDKESGFDFDTRGLTAGVDYRFQDNLVAGIALGYGKSDADFHANAGNMDTDGYSVSVYGTYYSQGSYYVDGIVSYGRNDYNSSRRISYTDAGGAVNETALGDTDGKQVFVGFSTGMDFNRNGWNFGPNASLYFVDLDIDGYRETGAGGLDLLFKDQSSNSLNL